MSTAAVNIREALELVRDGCDLDPAGAPIPPCPPPFALALLVERQYIQRVDGRLVLTASGRERLERLDPSTPSRRRRRRHDPRG